LRALLAGVAVALAVAACTDVGELEANFCLDNPSAAICVSPAIDGGTPDGGDGGSTDGGDAGALDGGNAGTDAGADAG
jgi:hypothetical protein